MKKPGKSQAGLARALKIDASGVSKMLAGKREIKAREVPIIERYLHNPAPSPEPDFTSAKANAIKVQVVGAIQAGVWRTGLEWPPDEQYAISVSIDPRYPIARYTGLEVRGTSMNKIYSDGTVLVCISAIEQRVEPKSGENVIVRRRNRHGEFEYTVKELEILDSGHRLLWPRSDDPAYTEALEWHPGDVDEQDDLLVTGIVIRAV